MLRTKDGAAQTTSVVVRCVAVSIALTIVTIGVAPLSCLAEADKANSAAAPAPRPAETAFDLSHIDSTPDAILAIRLARIFQRPELDSDSVSALLYDGFRDILVDKNSLSQADVIGLSDVEQLVGPVGISYDPKKESNRHSISFALSYLRTIDPVDWKQLAQAVSTDEVKIVEESDGTRIEGITNAGLGPHPASVLLPKAGGMALHAKFKQKLADDQSTEIQPIHLAWAAGWNAVQDADIASMMDNRHDAWREGFTECEFHGLADLWQMAAVGLRFDETLQVNLVFSCNDEDAAKQVVEKSQPMLLSWLQRIKKESSLPKETESGIVEAINTAKISRDGNEVTVRLNPQFPSVAILTEIGRSLFDTSKETGVAKKEDDKINR